MSLALFLEQLFNGFQTGITLFLISAGLTIILGTMNFVNLAHGSQVMIGAYVATYFFGLTENKDVNILAQFPGARADSLSILDQFSPKPQ